MFEIPQIEMYISFMNIHFNIFMTFYIIYDFLHNK